MTNHLRKSALSASSVTGSLEGIKRSLRTRTALACLAGISSMVGGSGALAQGAPTSEVGIQEIIVTAQKRQENVNSVPMSISAATGDKLAEIGVSEPRDLVKLVPGLTVADSVQSTPIYTLRGIGFSDTALAGRPTVSVYLDEAPLPFLVEARGASLDLERVEVLKGPQGTLFGQNATGGAINYIAAKPTKEFAAGLDATYGRFNEINVNGFVSGPLSNTLRVRIAAESRNRDAWQISATHGGRNGQQKFLNGRAILVWEPSADFKAELTLNAWQDDSDSQAAQLLGVRPSIPPLAPFVPQVTSYPIVPLNARVADWVPGVDYDRNHKFYQANLRLDYGIGGGLKLTSLTSYSHFTENQAVDADAMAVHNFDPTIKGRISSISQELRLSGDVGDRGTFVIGGTASHDKVDESNDNDLSASTISFALAAPPLGLPPFLGYNAVTLSKIDTLAAFASGDYKVTDSIKLLAGIRYTDSRTKFEGCTRDRGNGSMQPSFGAYFNFVRVNILNLPPNPPILPGGCTTRNAQFAPELVRDKLNEDNVSWRVGAEWTPAPRSLVYATISKGYKSGSFPNLGATTFEQFQPAKQESVLAYELGFKTRILHNSVQLNGAVFYYDYKDKQVQGRFRDPFLGPLLSVVNIPKSDIRGAELQVTWIPVKGLTINAAGTYIKSRIRDYVGFDPDASLVNMDGDAFPQTPRWQGVGDVGYDFPISGNLNGFVGANATYHGPEKTQLGNIPGLTTKGYTLLDLRAGVETADGAWKATAWVRNAGDVYYWPTANRLIDVIVRYAGMPRTFGVSVSRKFK